MYLGFRSIHIHVFLQALCDPKRFLTPQLNKGISNIYTLFNRIAYYVGQRPTELEREIGE